MVQKMIINNWRGVGLCISFLVCAIFSKGFAAEAEEELFSREALSGIEQPIRVDIDWRRTDERFEKLQDFYLKRDTKPITIKELVDECHMTELFIYLVDAAPSLPLKMTVTVSNASGEGEKMTEFRVLGKEELKAYGFIEEVKK